MRKQYLWLSVGLVSICLSVPGSLSVPRILLAPDASGHLHVSGEDGDPSSIDCYHVSILKKTNEVAFSCFLQCLQCTRLPHQVCQPQILGDFSDQTMERTLPQKQLSRLLEEANFSKCHCPRTITMFLNSTASGLCRGNSS